MDKLDDVIFKNQYYELQNRYKNYNIKNIYEPITNNIIQKYKPLTNYFNHNNEIYILYFQDSKNISIIEMNVQPSFIEVIKYNNPNLSTNFIPLKNYNSDILNNFLLVYKDVNIINEKDNEINTDLIYVFVDEFEKIQITNYLKKLNKNGSIIFKCKLFDNQTELYIKLQKMFRNVYLYNPEISNPFEDDFFIIAINYLEKEKKTYFDFNQKINTFKNQVYINKIKLIDDLNDVKYSEKQLLKNSIMYCRKWGIEYFPYINNTMFNDIMGKQILSEMYGNIEPINFKFKTSHFNKKYSQLKSYKKKYSIRGGGSSINNKTMIPKFQIKFSGTMKKHNKKIITNNHKKSNIKEHNKGQNIKGKYINKISLFEDLYDINHQYYQTGKMIDTRRNFKIKNYNYQLPTYFQVNQLFRYYKSSGNNKKNDLASFVRNITKRNVSQAWLKFYEILSETNLLPSDSKYLRNKDTLTVKSLHLCEAPGAFIDCLEYYIKQKTNIKGLDWVAQSYKPQKGLSYFGDDFKLMKNYPNQWNWGVNGTGDITSYDNIISYSEISKNVDLMTSDCGIPMDEPGYAKIAFSSMVAMSYLLPIGSSMVLKILTPIELPIIWNIIYLWYNGFEDFRFFKPIQNAQSREFYIIGKKYCGIDQSILDKLMELVKKNNDDFMNIDFFNDKYPESFVRQSITISKILMKNWTYTIQKQLYYTDNFDKLNRNFFKNANKYIIEKNNDFIKKYNIIKLSN